MVIILKQLILLIAFHDCRIILRDHVCFRCAAQKVFWRTACAVIRACRAVITTLYWYLHVQGPSVMWRNQGNLKVV